jgi:hypothetical protein
MVQLDNLPTGQWEILWMLLAWARIPTVQVVDLPADLRATLGLADVPPGEDPGVDPPGIWRLAELMRPVTVTDASRSDASRDVTRSDASRSDASRDVTRSDASRSDASPDVTRSDASRDVTRSDASRDVTRSDASRSDASRSDVPAFLRPPSGTRDRSVMPRPTGPRTGTGKLRSGPGPRADDGRAQR